MNHLAAAVTNIPYYKKRDRGGEDAWLLTEELLAVADGVGGWNRKGVDPGIFARELCAHVWSDYKKLRVEEGKTCGEINLKTILIDAVAKTKAIGTSTFVMAFIERKEGILKTLNLGDSGFLIIRPKDNSDFELIFRSKEQQHRFNCPYQCGTNYGPPTNADVHAHMVKDKDIVILATDGVLDNLFDQDILTCVNKGFIQQSDVFA